MNLFSWNPTLEERVGIIYRRLVLIQTAAVADRDSTQIDRDDLTEAILDAACEARTMLEPIRHAQSICN